MGNYIHGWRQEINEWYQNLQEYFEAYGLEKGTQKIRQGELRDLGIETYHAVRAFWNIIFVAVGILPAATFLKAIGAAAEPYHLAEVTPLVVPDVISQLAQSSSGLLLAAVAAVIMEVMARIHYHTYDHIHR